MWLSVRREESIARSAATKLWPPTPEGTSPREATGLDAGVLFDTIEGSCFLPRTELESWQALSARLAASDAVPSAVAGRLRVLSARVAGRLGGRRSAVRVAVLPAEQEAFRLSLAQSRTRAALPHLPQWHCRTCGHPTSPPAPAGVAGTPFADSDATARVRRILQDAAEALTGVVQDSAPCPACKGTERVQTPEPCCPEDGTPLRGDLLGTCPACGRSVREGIPGWLPAPSPVGLARRELAGAIDAADPDQPVVVVSDGEAGLLPAAEQVEILQIAALLVTLPPVQQPQPLTASLAAFVERLIAHLVVPAGGPRLLPLSAEEKQLLAAVHLLVSARSELESRRVLICVGCGRTRPDDRDARLRRRDEQRRRVLLASVASAALTSLLTANPVSLLMVVRSLVASPAGAIGTSCPGCADQTAVSVRVPVCPHCLAAVRLPTARQCRCGHRFRLTAQPPRLFGPAGEQGIWTEFAASTAAAPRSAVIERRRPLPAGEPLIRSVDGTVGLDGDHVVLRNCLGEARVPLASLRDVDVTEPGGDGTGWLRLRTVPDGAERQRRDLPPHRDPFALLFDRAQADAARSVQRTIGTLIPTGAGCWPPHAA